MPTAETANSDKAVLSRKVRRVFSLDLHAWEQLMLFSLGVAGLIAVAVFVTTASVVILQREENSRTKGEFEAYKVDAGKQIASANARALEAQLALEKFKAPRNLSSTQQDQITRKVASFKGLRAVLGAVPPSAKNTEFLNQILRLLQAAEVDAFINLQGVEASVSPTGRSNMGTMLTVGFPAGVTMSFVTGNERGEAFSRALAEGLNDVGVIASAVGGRDEARMEFKLSQGADIGVTRNDKQFEPVIIVVGDKP